MTSEERAHYVSQLGAALCCSLNFLTIIPFRVPQKFSTEGDDPSLLGKSVVFWPMIGACLAFLLARIDTFLLSCYQPPIVASTMAWGVIILLTGALHEDGISDLCDSFGGHSPQQRLAIMKDSRVGSFGVLGLLFVMIVRIVLLAQIPSDYTTIFCLAAIVPSYQAMVLLPSFLSPARENGLGSLLKEIPPKAQYISLLISFLLGVILPWYLTGVNLPFYVWGIFPLVLLLSVGLFVLLGMKLFRGFTGDLLGSACVVTQCLFFIVYLSSVYTAMPLLYALHNAL